MRLKKAGYIVMAAIFVLAQFHPAYGYSMASEYLCELGAKLYRQGRYTEALSEFQKALLANPDYTPARQYIDMIMYKQVPKPAVQIPEVRVYPKAAACESCGTDMPKTSYIQTPQIQQGTFLPASPTKSIIENELSRIEEEGAVEKTQSPPQILVLDATLKDLRFPLEIEKDKSFIVRGQNISRFLITQPEIIRVEKISPDELSVTGNELGYTYLHVWDARDRWTIEFLGTPPKPKGMTVEEEYRMDQQKLGAFKVRYSVDWTEAERGRRIDDLKRTSYSWNHWMSINGETPYGKLDSQAGVRTVSSTTDLTYFTLGLEEGKWAGFDGFDIRGFDFAPEISNLAFSGQGLRGLYFDSPAFDKKLDYKLFWGREGGGRYGRLSPGLDESRDSYLDGIDISFSPVQTQNYDFSAFSGYGNDRPDYLNKYGYDFKTSQHFDPWKLDYEIGYDTENFANLLTANYSVPNFQLTSELRDTDKAFKSMNGGGWRAGELGLLTTASYRPFEGLDLSSRMDLFWDRLFPNPSNEDRLNEDFNIDAAYSIDPLTSMRLDYSFQNELGRLSPIRSHNAGIGFSRTFELFRRINTYANFRHQETKHFNSHASDYINEKIILGMRFNIISDLYYYINKELNWTEARFYGTRTRPTAFETGLDWNRQIFDSPFYGNIRLTYRDEEETVSPVSLLSGEDYLEGYAELTYRPTPSFEAYVSSRLRNIWADNPSVNKRMEANIYAGLRYLWDTGARWDPVGGIAGYVYKDLNYDGIRQGNEPSIEDIKVCSGKNNCQTTDVSGYYRFSKIRAKKAQVNIDISSLPSGFVLTTPVSQEVSIVQGKVQQVSFGIASRTEITGFVFEDTNGNSEFDGFDKIVKGVVLILEDGSSSTTDNTGRYLFSKAIVGLHTLNLDLNSLPPEYMPTVPITKDIELTEGASYIYNIPLQRIEN